MDDKSSLNFHIKQGDYFGTLATVLDFLRQSMKKNGYKQSDEELLKRKTKELVYLQKSHKIINNK